MNHTTVLPTEKPQAEKLSLPDLFGAIYDHASQLSTYAIRGKYADLNPAYREKMHLECQRLLAELQTLSQALAEKGGAQ